MVPADRRIISRALVAGMIVLAVGLSGCGRKANLDPPPTPAVTTQGGPAQPAPAKPDKPFFLDWLL